MDYAIACACGQTARGTRRPRHQVVPCSSCARPIIVLPQSAWAALDAPAGELARGGLPARLARTWKAPLLAGGACLVVTVAAFLALWPFLGRDRFTPTGSGAPEPVAGFEERYEAGRRALGEGRVHAARAALTDAVNLRDRTPTVLDPPGHRKLNQLHRQADLLARLSSHPVEEVVRRAALVRDPDEWEATFAEHRGRTIIFDDTLARDGAGQPVQLGYDLRVNDEPVRLALEDLTVLRDLPLEPPVRVIFGARMLRVSREAGGTWVVRLEPDSAVLLTDEAAAQVALPAVDGAAQEVLARQGLWVETLAVVKPAAP